VGSGIPPCVRCAGEVTQARMVLSPVLSWHVGFAKTCSESGAGRRAERPGASHDPAGTNLRKISTESRGC
jgi:hypothetical protein